MFDPYISIPHVKTHTNFHRRATDMASVDTATLALLTKSTGPMHATDIY